MKRLTLYLQIIIGDNDFKDGDETNTHVLAIELK